MEIILFNSKEHLPIQNTRVRASDFTKHARKSICPYKTRAREHPPIKRSSARSGRYVSKLIFAFRFSVPLSYYSLNITRNVPRNSVGISISYGFVKYNPFVREVVRLCCRILCPINSLGQHLSLGRSFRTVS